MPLYKRAGRIAGGSQCPGCLCISGLVPLRFPCRRDRGGVRIPMSGLKYVKVSLHTINRARENFHSIKV